MTVRVLVSYHYHRNTDLAELVDRLGGDVDLFADSGAYSASTTGATIHLADYAAWLRHWEPLFTVQAGLDVIGDPAATGANVNALRDAGCNPLPVFHVGTPWAVLEDLCAENRYLALGGMALLAVGRAKFRPLMAWLIRCFRIAREHGAVFHGFGMTSSRIVQQLPFYSIDSSSYTQGTRFGLAYLWDDRNRRIQDVFFRNPDEVRQHEALFPAHGLDPARTIHPDFMRPDNANSAADRLAINAACALAYRRFGVYLADRHQVPAPPLPRCAETGTKVYLAMAGTRPADVEPLAPRPAPALERHPT